MNYTVVNHGITVGNIGVNGITSSSVFLIGDTESISMGSIFDTPPESLIIGPFVPLTPE